MARAPASIKRLFVGRPMSSGELEHTLLPKTIALPVFASDPLSSNAYATQETMLVLGTAGTASGALDLTYPHLDRGRMCSGDRRHLVSPNRARVPVRRRRLPSVGREPRDVAGAPCRRCVAGRLRSHGSGLDHRRRRCDRLGRCLRSTTTECSLRSVFVVFVTLANLRGVKESGTLFAIPTYGFVAVDLSPVDRGFHQVRRRMPPG